MIGPLDIVNAIRRLIEALFGLGKKRPTEEDLSPARFVVGGAGRGVSERAQTETGQSGKGKKSKGQKKPGQDGDRADTALEHAPDAGLLEAALAAPELPEVDEQKQPEMPQRDSFDTDSWEGDPPEKDTNDRTVENNKPRKPDLDDVLLDAMNEGPEVVRADPDAEIRKDITELAIIADALPESARDQDMSVAELAAAVAPKFETPEKSGEQALKDKLGVTSLEDIKAEDLKEVMVAQVAADIASEPLPDVREERLSEIGQMDPQLEIEVEKEIDKQMAEGPKAPEPQAPELQPEMKNDLAQQGPKINPGAGGSGGMMG